MKRSSLGRLCLPRPPAARPRARNLLKAFSGTGKKLRGHVIRRALQVLRVPFPQQYLMKTGNKFADAGKSLCLSDRETYKSWGET